MLAAIDVGSNTLRLLLGDVVDGKVVPKRYLRRICRLAGGLTHEEGLSAQSRERTLLRLQDLLAACRLAHVTHLRAVGTAAFRQAVNGQAFADEIRTSLRIPFEIISGEDEARLTACGVLGVLSPIPPWSLLIDIGGGSTEFVLCHRREVLWSRSIALGVVRLTETRQTILQRTQVIENALADVRCDVLSVCRAAEIDPDRIELVGTAGTATTLAALNMQMKRYDWRRVNNYKLSKQLLQDWQARLTPMSHAERETLPGMEPGRGDLITAGLEILLYLMSSLAFDSMTVSDSGLLEGLLMSLQKSRMSWSFD